jgi:hypothetical protein
MIAASSVSRKTMKKMGTEKRFLVILAAVGRKKRRGRKNARHSKVGRDWTAINEEAKNRAADRQNGVDQCYLITDYHPSLVILPQCPKEKKREHSWVKSLNLERLKVHQQEFKAGFASWFFICLV